MLLLIIASVLDEWTKKFVPGRHSNVAEMGINIMGAAIGVFGSVIFV